MKPSQLIASAVVAAVLGTAGISIAGATSGGGSTASPAPDAASAASAASTAGTRHATRAVRRAVRNGLALAAKTIGIDTKTLVQQLKAGKSIADVATDHGVQPSTVVTALVNAATAKINAAKTAHKITDAQATKLLANLNDRVTNLVNRKGTFRKGNANIKQRVRRHARAGIAVAAHAIGIDPKVLVQQLKSGKSIADVATDYGVQPSTVVTALVNAATAKINAAKAAHKITDAQATKLLAHLNDRVTKIVNRHFRAGQRADVAPA